MARSLQIFAAICSVAAAVLWWVASGQLPDPPSGAFAEAVEPQKPIYRAAVRRATLMNRAAAVLSAIAAALIIVSLLLATG
jgi:hypothetical protein